MKKSSCQNFNNMKIEIISKVENLLEDIKVNLQLIDIWKLKKETLIILNIAKRLCFLLKINDPLKKKIKLSSIDCLFGIGGMSKGVNTIIFVQMLSLLQIVLV